MQENLYSWKEKVKKKEDENYRPLLIFGNEHRGIGENIFNLRNKFEK